MKTLDRLVARRTLDKVGELRKNPHRFVQELVSSPSQAWGFIARKSHDSNGEGNLNSPQLNSAAFVILIIISTAPLGPPNDSKTYAIHEPILINGNINFTAANGVSSGEGTPSNPFIIEGWEIDASGGTGIAIADTDLHFVIRDVFIHSGGTKYFGILLQNVRNGAIENSTFAANLGGIYLRYVGSVRIERNLAIDNGPRYGIWLEYVTDITVSDNVLSRNQAGMEIYYSSGVTVSSNLIDHNLGYGMSIVDAQQLNVSRNNFIENARNAYSPEIYQGRVSLFWDGGYVSGGNYWSDYSGTDSCSGPQQDDCGNPDGIGDDPYAIEFEDSDRYPLVGALPLGPSPFLLRHMPIHESVASQAIHFEAELTGGTSAQIVTLYIKTIDTANYVAMPMSQVGSGRYIADIGPPGTSGVIWYYILAENSTGVRVREPAVGLHRIVVQDDAPSIFYRILPWVAAAVAVVAIALVVWRARKRRRSGH